MTRASFLRNLLLSLAAAPLLARMGPKVQPVTTHPDIEVRNYLQMAAIGNYDLRPVLYEDALQEAIREAGVLTV